MYDLHAHILPGVDDGAVTPEDTLAMSRVAARNRDEGCSGDPTSQGRYRGLVS